jgi:hypothetical protein
MILVCRKLLGLRLESDLISAVHLLGRLFSRFSKRRTSGFFGVIRPLQR